MVRRVSFDIMAEIIDFCRQPRSKTRIMYSANLSYAAAQKYIGDLLSANMLKEYQFPRVYRATEKGMVFIEKWIELNNFIDGGVDLTIRPGAVPLQFVKR